VSEQPPILGYAEWEEIVQRADELYTRHRKSRVGGQGLFRDDFPEYWHAVATKERIAAALNAQAGVVEALPAEMTLERSPALYDGVSGQQAYVWGYNDCRAAALAAIKEKDRG
jgi:hypothetical protein